MRKEVDLDDILQETGEFGKYQIIVMFIISISVIFNGMVVNEYVFSAGDLNYRCHIPECEGDSVNHENYYVPWLDNAISSRCKRYAPFNNTIKAPIEGTCPSNIFNNNVTITCETFVYEKTNTIVYEFNINCQDWKRTLVGTIRSIGTLIVHLLTGLISDRFGRRIALTFNAIGCGIIGGIKSFSVSYKMFLIMNLLETALSSGTYPTTQIYATELVGPKWRTLASVTMSSCNAIGEAICGLVAWNFPEWRTFTRVLYFPQLVAFIYLWILPESVRWLISKKKYPEAESIIKKMAKRNGKELSQRSLANLTNSKEMPIKTVSFAHAIRKSFGSKVIMKRLMIIPFCWVTMTLLYYGLTINSVGLTGNIYLNFILVALIEIPGYYTAAFALNILGRKKTLFLSFVSCALACFVFSFIHSAWLRLTFYLVGKFFSSMIVTSIYIYTAELFPTELRQSYLSFCSVFGRIGAIVAPQTPLLVLIWAPLPMIIFGSFAVTSALLVLLTPETKGMKLTDTIAEAENVEHVEMTKL